MDKGKKVLRKCSATGNRQVSQAIVCEVTEMMERIMQRVLIDDPFIPEIHHSSKPLYAALVPDEIFKGSHFERRFVTPFGSIWEKLAVVAGHKCHGHCEKGYTIKGTIGEERLRRIQEILNKLEHPIEKKKVSPNWETELEYIKAGGGKPIPVSVVCDIYIDSKTMGKKYAFELKAPLPNSDQTKVSKEKMFKLLAMNENLVDEAYYALPYNPYGKNKADYAWSFPARWFNMKTDKCVLIGEEFWNLVGGKKTYQLFIKEVNKLGVSYRKQIYEEYLGIEPPKGYDKDILM